MKAVRILLVVAMTCVLFGAQGIAISEEGSITPPLRHILDISLSAEPSILVESGEVQLAFNIINHSEYSAENLYFTDSEGELQDKIGRVSAGDEKVFACAYDVSEEELSAGILNFTVVHDEITGSGDSVEYEVSTKIQKVEAYADVEFIRRISSPVAAEGAQVTITYRIKNIGNVPVEEVLLEDAAGDFSAEIETLACGEEKIFTSSVSIQEETVSSPVLRYRAPLVDDSAHKKTLIGEKIRIASPELTAELELDTETAQTGDIIRGVVNITANGGSFTDVYVKDDVNGVLIADCLEIPDGETVSVACSWPARRPSDYRMAVSGMSESGVRYDISSSTVNVGLTGEFSESDLRISAETETPVICRPGLVRVIVSIENDGNSAARNVLLRETGLGEIREFAFIPTGEPTLREVVLDVTEDTVYEFCVCLTGEDGILQTAAAVALPVSIDESGAEPENPENEDEPGISEWFSRNFSDKATYMRLLAVAGAVLGILGVILVVSHSREYMHNRQRKAHRSRSKRGDNESHSRRK